MQERARIKLDEELKAIKAKTVTESWPEWAEDNVNKWTWLILYAVTIKNLGPRCVDGGGCENIVRYSVKGEPACESTRKEDCDYLEDVAKGLNLLEAQRSYKNDFCESMHKNYVSYGCEDTK